MDYKNLKEIIEVAIAKEEEAFTIYTQAAEQTTEPSVRKLFKDLAKEEIKHKEKLSNLDTSGHFGETPIPSSSDARYIDFLVDKPVDALDNIQDVFIFAMKRERLAQHFYANTAKALTDSNAKQLFLLLANEEKNHLERLETVYDDKIQSEN